MSGDFVSTTPGSVGSPQAHNAYKRAVYRRAPNKFTVEVLPSQRQGGAHNYGMLISPVISDTASIMTHATGATTTPAATSEYEVWRRWEDCLIFQETLEAEYNLRAKSKARDLAAGRGVQKNGVYIRSDRAASFDSLPCGPDADSILKDVHAYLPTLTRKGSLFRASNHTVQRRQEEFSSLIMALFSPDLPTLLREIRASRTVRDFFGFWRRDADLVRKREKEAAKAKQALLNQRNSGFVPYFAASTSSLHSIAWADYPAFTPKAIDSPVSGAPAAKVGSARARIQRSRSSPSPEPVPRLVPASAPAVPGITFTNSHSSSDSSLVSPSSEAGVGEPAIRIMRSLEPMVIPSRPQEFKGRTDPSFSAPTTPFIGRRLRSGLNSPSEKRVARLFETPPASPDEPISTSPIAALIRRTEELETDTTGTEYEESMSAMSDYEHDGHVEDEEAADKLGSLSRRLSSGSHRRRSLTAWDSMLTHRGSWYTDTSMSINEDGTSASASSLSSRPVSIATTISLDLETAFPKPPPLTWLPMAQGTQGIQGTSVARRATGPTTPSVRGISNTNSPEPGANLRRSLSAGSNRPRQSYESARTELGGGSQDGDSIVDAYFYASSPSSGTTITRGGADGGASTGQSRQRVSMRHPGSFHLPWAPVPMPPIPEPTSPVVPTAPTSPALPSSRGFEYIKTQPSNVDFPSVSQPSFPATMHRHRPLASASYSSLRPSTSEGLPGSPSSAMSVNASLSSRPGSSDGSVVLKVAAGEHIVLVRVPRGSSLVSARQRIVAKLTEQGAPPRSTSFALAFLPPGAVATTTTATANPTLAFPTTPKGRRPRSGSVSSMETASLRPLVNDEVWEDAVRGCGGKLALRVIDVPE